MPSTDRTSPRHGLAGALRSRTALLLAFSFAVMADPVSSVAYAIEAALRALDGDLALLVPTMVLVVGIIALVILNYRQLIIRYPQGGGAAAATGEAFGDRWSFIPIAALAVASLLPLPTTADPGPLSALRIDIGPREVLPSIPVVNMSGSVQSLLGCVRLLGRSKSHVAGLVTLDLK